MQIAIVNSISVARRTQALHAIHQPYALQLGIGFNSAISALQRRNSRSSAATISNTASAPATAIHNLKFIKHKILARHRQLNAVHLHADHQADNVVFLVNTEIAIAPPPDTHALQRWAKHRYGSITPFDEATFEFSVTLMPDDGESTAAKHVALPVGGRHPLRDAARKRHWRQPPALTRRRLLSITTLSEKIRQ